ncbi:MAG: hypothetical protein KDD50_09800 [Bdellovibrionales bacterium]|nr:hypothetical protein [Bdellovibrionales bacterium]
MTPLKKIFILLTLIFSSNIHAQVITDFVYQIGFPEYSLWVLKNQGTQRFNEALSPVLVHQPIETQLSGVSIQGQQDSKISIENEKNRSFQVQTTLRNISINVESLISDGYIERNNDNFNLKIHIHGECSKLQAHLLNENYQINTFLIMNEQSGQLQFNINAIDLPNDDLIWAVDTERCVGPRGFADEALQAIENKLKDRWFIQEALMQALQRKMNTLVNEINSKLFILSEHKLSNDLNLSIHPKTLRFGNDNQLLILGEASLSSILNPYETKISFRYFPEEFNRMAFILPENSLHEIFRFLYKSRVLSQNFYSNQIDGFKSLMKSRFKQFFVWPDLMNFKKKTNFLFQTAPQQEPILQDLSANNGALQGQLYSYVNLHMLAPVDSSWTPYIVFESHVLTEAKMEIQNQKLNIAFENSRINYSDHWDSSYVSKYHPNQRISNSSIRTRIEEALNDYRLDFNLPTLDFYKEQFIPYELGFKNENVFIYYRNQGDEPSVNSTNPTSESQNRNFNNPFSSDYYN